jgi:hypothetical protein
MMSGCEGAQSYKSHTLPFPSFLLGYVIKLYSSQVHGLTPINLCPQGRGSGSTDDCCS